MWPDCCSTSPWSPPAPQDQGFPLGTGSRFGFSMGIVRRGQAQLLMAKCCPQQQVRSCHSNHRAGRPWEEGCPELSTRGGSSSAVISKGLPSSREPRCSRGCGKPVPTAFLTCKVNYEPAILLLLLLDKGFGLLKAFRSAAVTEEEAGETLKHGGERSRRMDGELGSC